jgi:hypothetical protein
MPGGRMTPGATAWPPPSKRRGKWSSSGILVVREAETAVSARRRREEPALATTWVMGALTCRPAAVGVRRRSEPPAARVWRAVGAARRARWAAKGLPQRHSLLALGSASFRRRVRTDGCVGPLRSRPEGAPPRFAKKEFRLAQNRGPGVKSFRGRPCRGERCIVGTLRKRNA